MDVQQVALTVFQGRVGDHNERATNGARVVGAALSDRLGVPSVLVGTPAPVLAADWQIELAAARPELQAMSTRYAELFAAEQIPVTAMTRCAVALATLPQVSAHRPDAVVVWFDAHADLNTPANTTTGYLGGLALSGPLGWWDSGFGAGLGTDRAILVGTRDLDAAEQQHVDAGTITLVGPGAQLADRLRTAVAGRPVYVHLDCDVLEPGIAPTDYRVPGGLTLQDLQLAALVLAEAPIVGLEIAEFESSSRPVDDVAAAGALIEALAPLLTGR